jgi:dihydrofolate reductase
MKPELVLIAAVARNGVIGDGNQLLWHLPEDARHFRDSTRGHPVIMGRKTWDSVPARFRPLPGRRNLVVTRQPAWQAAGAEALPSLEAALQAVAGAPRAFVIGGAGLYAEALPLADELLLTEIDRDFEGEISFPAFNRQDWDVAAREVQHAEAPNDFDFAFVRYRRRA